MEQEAYGACFRVALETALQLHGEPLKNLVPKWPTEEQMIRDVSTLLINLRILPLHAQGKRPMKVSNARFPGGFQDHNLPPVTFPNWSGGDYTLPTVALLSSFSELSGVELQQARNEPFFLERDAWGWHFFARKKN